MSLKNNFDFSEFLSISSEAWKAKILEELKTSPNQSIDWKAEDLLIHPFYTRKDLDKISYLDNYHSHFSLKSPRHWYTREIIPVKNSSEAASLAEVALNSGADAIAYDIRDKAITDNDLLALVKNISLKFSPVHFYIKASPLHLAKALVHHNLYDIKGSIFYSPLTDWIEKKNFSAIDLDELATSIQLLKEVPRYKIVTIDASYFHHKEAGIAKEIAYSISLAMEYIDQLTEKNLSMRDVLTNFEFSFSIGKNYFLEIAKLRAFRLLWKKIAETCDPEFDALTTPLHCTTSVKYFSQEDPHRNILHNTTEAMAAIIGGCDSLSIVPFDKNIKDENRSSSRISRNISLILKDESYFDKTVDPAAGSYYIENLTNDLAEKAWTIISEIEQQGGFVKALKKNNYEL